MTKEQKQAYEFILYCYFGKIDNPIEAAIDRAYVDMAAHTLKGFGADYKAKWECRYKATQAITSALESIDDNFCDWHLSLRKEIKKIYENYVSFSHGQAQKWINMTMKYLYVFKLVFEDMKDDRLEKIPAFFKSDENISKLHIPLDNYILKELNFESLEPWSQMNEIQYKEFINNTDKNIQWELENWNIAAENYKQIDSKSYSNYKIKRNV